MDMYTGTDRDKYMDTDTRMVLGSDTGQGHIYIYMKPMKRLIPCLQVGNDETALPLINIKF
jgi:hypothetical protein